MDQTLSTSMAPSSGQNMAFAAVQELVEIFHSNKSHYLSADYQEAEVRRDFIDKLFVAFGWDVNHDTQRNPYEQEVKVERSVSAGGQRRADYAFYFAPNFRDPRFFVEAKKPYGDIATAENYFQIIRYGWNSGTALAVLTDFEQFHIIDCRYKPDLGTALHRAVAKFHYLDYADPDKFAKIYWLFSREAVAAGSLEKQAAELPKLSRKARQRGFLPGSYKPVDEAFLEDLDEYRKELARTFKTSNPDLDSEALTEIAQRTLDRLVFLRFLEDKQIEQQPMIANFGDRGTVWEDFVATSRRLDGVYNGVVFKRHAILDADDFHVDQRAFGGICERLAHVNSPYDFNAIPLHILGAIYERFLGKVIVATEKRARVEEKPEVRKAGGVYYTPEYIVRYIVGNTVGKLIEGKTPAEIAEMRFADIACGSGSFLLGVYDLLIRHHGNYYNSLPKTERSWVVRQGNCIDREGKLYLSLRTKREILLNNIYGVDIDSQAVEVAQLSLYLKLLEEETTVSAKQYLLKFAHTAKLKKLLPDLGQNIVCGNSLISWDIVDGQLFSAGEERKLHPMNFEDVFPKVMKYGGFDAIVGNPPYIFTRNEGFTPVQKKYFYEHFHHQSTQLNTFGLFLERSHSLLRAGGTLGYITPNNWLTIDTFAPLRKFVLKTTSDLTFINVLDRVFAAADVDTAVVHMTKGAPTKLTISEMRAGQIEFTREVDLSAVKPPQFIVQIGLLKDGHAQILLERIESASRPLREFCTVSTGLKAYQIGKGKPQQSEKHKRDRAFHASRQVNKTYGRYLEGVNVCRYLLSWSGEWLSYGNWLAEPRRSVPFNGERLLIRQIPATPPHLVHGVFTDSPCYNDINSMVVFAPRDGVSLKYILALLNSRLLSFWFHRTYDKLQRKIFPQFKVNELARFPIRDMNLADSTGKEKHDELVQLVEQMLAAKEALIEAWTSKDKNFYEQKCDSLDRQIDRLVYDLYGLTEDEIAIVEEATK